MMRRLVVAVVVLFLFSAAARADVLYTLTEDWEGLPSPLAPVVGTYSFLEPSILTSDTTITATDLLSFTGTPLEYIIFDPTDTNCPFTNAKLPQKSCIEIENLNSNIYNQLITVDLTSYGAYTFTKGSLEISQNDETPEPSSLILLGTALAVGLLSFAGVARRRLWGNS
jgi:hypothetical protein